MLKQGDDLFKLQAAAFVRYTGNASEVTVGIHPQNICCPDHLDPYQEAGSIDPQEWQYCDQPLGAEEAEEFISQHQLLDRPLVCAFSSCQETLAVLQGIQQEDLQTYPTSLQWNNLELRNGAEVERMLGSYDSEITGVQVSDFDVAAGDSQTNQRHLEESADSISLDVRVDLLISAISEEHSQQLGQQAQAEIYQMLTGQAMQVDSQSDAGTEAASTTTNSRKAIPLEIQVRGGQGNMMTMRVLSSVDDLQQAQTVDAQAFGEHQGISVEYLQEITRNGAVVAIDDPLQPGKMIGEGQVILRALPGAEESVVRTLPLDAAYFEGFGVAPEAQGQGIGQAVLDGVSQIAQQQGKTSMYCSVRPENAASIAAQFKAGFQIREYHPDYYEGADGSGARIVNQVRFGYTPGAMPVHHEAADLSSVFALAAAGDAVSIRFRSGDSIDKSARELMAPLLNELGYTGTHMQSIGEDRTSFLLIFQKDI